MASQARLDLVQPEIVALILEYVDDTSPRSTRNIALSSKYLYSVYRLIKNRHKTLRINGDKGLDTLPTIIDKWSDDGELLANIRTLTVEGSLPPWSGSSALDTCLADEDLWRPMTRFISRIGRLRVLIWNLPTIPVGVLRTLHETQMSVDLRMFKFQPSAGPQPSDIDKALAASPALTHLRYVAGFHRRPSPDMQETAFRRIVARAPLVYAGIIKEERYQNLDPQVVALQKNFGRHKKRNSTIKVLTLDGVPISKATLDDWSEIITLASLEEIKFSRGFPSADYFQCAPSILPNLRHVRLNFRALVGYKDAALIAAIQSYLYTCPNLETLSLWSWNGVVELKDLLKQHGPNLRSLHLHEREDTIDAPPRRILTVSEVKDILAACPRLKEFTFDLQRPATELNLSDTDPNMPYFRALQTAKLDAIQIYFDFGLAWLGYAADQHDDEEDSDDNDIENDEEDDDDDDDDDDNDDDDDDEDDTDIADGNVPTNTTTTTQDDDNVSTVSSSTHPTKPRAIEPSSPEDLTKYAGAIWKVIFANTTGGSRRLEVKFGEWEAARRIQHTGFSDNYVGRKFVHYKVVRPAERDDQREQCDITHYRIY